MSTIMSLCYSMIVESVFYSFLFSFCKLHLSYLQVLIRIINIKRYSKKNSKIQS